MAGENIEKINGKAPLSETGKKVSVFGNIPLSCQEILFLR